MYALYTDDSILVGPEKDKIDRTIKQINDEAGINIINEGYINNFLRVNIDKQNDGNFHLNQTKLIDQII